MLIVLQGLCAQTVQEGRWEQAGFTQFAPFALFLCCFGCIASGFSVSLVPPEFIQGSGSTTNISVSLHGALTLTCEATGVPLPTVTWSWNGSPVAPSEHMQVLSGQG